MASLTFKVVMKGQRALARAQKRRARKLFKAAKKNTRKAANVIRKAVRQEIRAKWRRNSNEHWRTTTVSVRTRRRKFIRAEVGPTFKGGVAAIVQEKGGSVTRPQHTRTRLGQVGRGRGRRRAEVQGPLGPGQQKRRWTVRAHTARYAPRPVVGPALVRTERVVFRLIGKSFRLRGV